jgi:hypothetical protein
MVSQIHTFYSKYWIIHFQDWNWNLASFPGSPLPLCYAWFYVHGIFWFMQGRGRASERDHDWIMATNSLLLSKIQERKASER